MTFNEQRGWDIPQDWDGETWTCWKIHWPDSTEYRRLLVALLYTLTRGRSYNRASGNIKDAQGVGWLIFEANTELKPCDGDTGQGNASPENSDMCGGSIFIISEDDEMGQVVTEVKIDPETGDLLVYYGHCCVERLSLGALLTAAVSGTGEIGTDPTFPTPGDGETLPGELPTWTACGKAETVVDRMAAIGHAAWNNWLTPWEMAEAIKDANPAYSVSMTDVTTLYLAVAQLRVVEGLADTDIFNDEFLRDWKCHIRGKTAPGEAKGLSQTEFNLMVLTWLGAYPFTSEAIDFDVLGDFLVADFWRIIASSILGYTRFNQICAEAIGVEGDCSDCAEIFTGDPAAAQDPLASGYYLGPDIKASGLEEYHDNGWSAYGVYATLVKPVYGVYIRMKAPTATIKRMDWANQGWLTTPVDVSVFGNTSDHLENFGAQYGVPIVGFWSPSIALEFAEQQGHTAVCYVETVGGLIEAAIATTGQTAGARIDVAGETGSEILEARFIYNIND